MTRSPISIELFWTAKKQTIVKSCIAKVATAGLIIRHCSGGCSNKVKSENKLLGDTQPSPYLILVLISILYHSISYIIIIYIIIITRRHATLTLILIPC